jgi:hypothetical protein
MENMGAENLELEESERAAAKKPGQRICIQSAGEKTTQLHHCYLQLQV